LKHRLFRVVEELIYESAKKFKIAAAGLFGEMLRFFNAKDASYTIS
jgi:hypothetical protein